MKKFFKIVKKIASAVINSQIESELKPVIEVPENTWVWACKKGGYPLNCFTAMYDGTNWIDGYGDRIQYDNFPTHWMKIPEISDSL